jgi:hypothetical protein
VSTPRPAHPLLATCAILGAELLAVALMVSLFVAVLP